METREGRDGWEQAGKAECVCALWSGGRSELALAGVEVAMKVCCWK